MLKRPVCALTLLAIATPALAAKITLKNDKVRSDGTVAFQGGFAKNEEGAATLGPLSDPFLIQTIRFLFGDSGSKKVTVRIYEDTGQAAPGKLLAEFPDMIVTGSKKAMSEVDVTAKQIRVPAGQKIRVAILDQDGGKRLPGIAHDMSNAPLVGRNWIKAIPGGWIAAPIFGIKGNWVIRAVVDTIPTAGDGGPANDASDGTTTDGGAPSAESGPGGDATPPVGDDASTTCVNEGDCPSGMTCENKTCVAATPNDDGCGCRTTRPRASMLIWLALLGLALAGRRRRRRS